MTTSTAALRDLAAEAARRFGDSDVEPLLRWARETFGDRLVLASSMGDEVLVHLTAQTIPGIDVLFLDTGYHFAETLGTRDAVATTLDVRMITVTPLRTVAEQDAEYGPALHEREPDRCCAMRKVEPLQRGLSGYDAWITGMRREDAPTRSDIEAVAFDEKRGMVKLNPLAAWTNEQLDAYAAEHQVLMNPLRQVGYPSIGCAPCTRPVAAGADPRSGRWAGSAKTECGLHT